MPALAIDCAADKLHVSQGQGLVEAMQQVPAPFFQEVFDLDQRQLWEGLVEVINLLAYCGDACGCICLLTCVEMPKVVFELPSRDPAHPCAAHRHVPRSPL